MPMANHLSHQLLARISPPVTKLPGMLCVGRYSSLWSGGLPHKPKDFSNDNMGMSLNKFGDSKRNKCTGLQLINNPKLFKGLAHTEEERNSLGIRGLLPAAVRPMPLQIQSVLNNLRRYPDDLSRFLLLREVQDTNQKLFFRVLCEHTEELMPYVYTPVVGEACLKYSKIYRRPRGLYITINDIGYVEEILKNWPETDIKAIVVTDGERILGLGDLGANGMGIPVGKLSLYTALAGIPPYMLLPVTLDVGTNNKEFLEDPMYIGLRHNRITGEKYDALVEEFMRAVVKRYGRSCLIQFEDFGNHNAFRLLDKYVNDYCTFNDDIQGTASVAVAGILASIRITGTRVREHTFLFYGAGEAALGIADLLIMQMTEEGLTAEKAAERIWLVDSKGLVVKDRAAGGIDGHKAVYAKEGETLTELDKIMEFVKPTALIGVSAQPKKFTPKVMESMLQTCKQPIIFSLSNPTHKSECTAEEAYTATDGNCIFASGSPFPPVTYKGKTFHPGQGNNAYIFPGVALALIATNALKVENKVFLVAAKALAEQVTKEHMDEGRVYPPLDKIRDVSLIIASEVARYLYETGQASHKPQPKDMEEFLRSKQYDHIYE